MMRAIRLGWVLLCVAVLLHYALNRSMHEIQFMVFIGMIVLSFPVGWLAAMATGWLFFGLDLLFGHQPSIDEGTIVFWSVALVLGYWQWFVLTPFLIRRFKARNRNDVV